MSLDASFKSVIGRVVWSFLNVLGNQGGRVVFTILLARLLSPDEFGLIAMITIVVGYADTLLNFGLGPALIQNQEVNQSDYSSVFWLNIFFGAILTSVIALSAPFIAAFYGEYTLVNLVLVLSTRYFIISFGIVHKVLLLKHQNIKKLTMVEFFSVLLSGLVAIYIATQGGGVWSLVAQILTQAVFFVCFLWVASSWSPSFVFSLNSIKKIFNFSINLFANNSLNYWTNNADNILVGKFLGDASLGVYRTGFNLVFGFTAAVNGALFNVLFPLYSSFRLDIEKIKQSYFKAVESIIYVLFPFLVGLFFFAEDITLLLFGGGWEEIGPLLKCFAIASFFQAITSMNGNVYLSLCRSDLELKANVVGKLIILSGIIIGLVSDALNGVALSLAISYPIAYIVNSSFLLKLISEGFISVLLKILKLLLLQLALGSLLFW